MADLDALLGIQEEPEVDTTKVGVFWTCMSVTDVAWLPGRECMQVSVSAHHVVLVHGMPGKPTTFPGGSSLPSAGGVAFAVHLCSSTTMSVLIMVCDGPGLLHARALGCAVKWLLRVTCGT